MNYSDFSTGLHYKGSPPKNIAPSWLNLGIRSLHFTAFWLPLLQPMEVPNHEVWMEISPDPNMFILMVC